MAKGKESKRPKKYFANIEGTEYPWDKETITVAEIRQLGKLPREHQVVEEFPGGKEKTLKERDTVILKSGHRYGRAPKFRRG
ncbi:multiubiquitin domain-containing protein [Thermoproteota archaeon]